MPIAMLGLGLPVFPFSAPGAEERLEHGRRIYNYYCYYCHGYAGNAETLASTMLSPPPKDFTSIAAEDWNAGRMRDAVRKGRPGTAMPAFENRLDHAEIDRVLTFVEAVFVRRRADNINYHSPANGWSGTQFTSPAAPFVLRQLNLETDPEALTPAQRDGRNIYLKACVSCHDNVASASAEPVWQSRAVSYPRGHYDHKDPASAYTGASPYSQHDVIPVVEGLTPQQQLGQRLFQANCAFCHGADGSGENWIGSFLDPKPRNLGIQAVRAMSDEQLAERIAQGLPGTSMPSWRHVLGESEIEALVTYIRIAFQHDAGLSRNQERSP